MKKTQTKTKEEIKLIEKILEEYCKIVNERLTKLNNGNDGIPPSPKE